MQAAPSGCKVVMENEMACQYQRVASTGLIQFLIFKLSTTVPYSSNLAVNKPEKQFLQCRQLFQKIREWKGSCSAVCLEFIKVQQSAQHYSWVKQLKMMPTKTARCWFESMEKLTLPDAWGNFSRRSASTSYLRTLKHSTRSSR